MFDFERNCDMIVKSSRKGEKLKMNKREMCRNLWAECFQDSELYMDYYFTEKWKTNIVLWEKIGHKAVSMVHLNPYCLNYCGKLIKSYYIVGVATDKNYRKMGKMRSLLEQSFSLMKKQTILFTFLMPADRKIYEPFGFQFIYTQRRYKLHNIKKEILDNGIVSKVIEELSEKEWEQCLSFCEKKLEENFDIYVIRDKEYYKNLQKECKASNGEVRLFFKDKKLLGILSYGRNGEVLEVTESLIHSDWTKEILEKLLSIEKVQTVLFYESYFLDNKAFIELTEDITEEEVPIIMAKVLKQSESFETVLKGKRVYLNEIV